jgi:hypothetical protein
MARSKEIAILTVAGGVGFWLTNFAISLTPIAADYRAALSISYFPMIIESLIGGLVIGLIVSYLLLRFFNTLPTKSPISKSVLLSFIILIIITMLVELPAKYFTPMSGAWHNFLIGGVFNILRFLTLGFAIGYYYKKLNIGLSRR